MFNIFRDTIAKDLTKIADYFNGVADAGTIFKDKRALAVNRIKNAVLNGDIGGGGDVTPEIEAEIENAQWKTETSTPLFSETVTTESEGDYYSASITYEGDTPEGMIKVVFDGVTYELSPDTGYGAPYVPATDSYDFSVYPFALEFDAGSCTLLTETSGTHTISVESISVTYTDTFSDGVKNNAVRWVTFEPPGLDGTYYVADTEAYVISNWVNNGNYVCGRIGEDIYFLANSRSHTFARFVISSGNLSIRTLERDSSGDGSQYQLAVFTLNGST